jgi:protein ImuB
VPPGSQRAAIEPLVVQALRIDEGTVQTLARLGITHIDQLLQLPRSGLAPRLGNQLVLRIAQALGEIDEPLTVHRAAAEYRETHLLQYPTSDQQILVDRVQRLTKKIGASLAARQRGALRIACRLDLISLPSLTIDIGLFKPTATADHLSGLIVHRLESQQLAGLVQRLTLEVTLSGPLGCVQTSLFDPSLNRQCLSRLIDSLSSRLGREAVVGIKLQDNPLPEQAFSTIPLAGNPAVAMTPRRNSDKPRRNSDSPMMEPGSSRRQVGPSPRDPLRRPCSLLRDPIRLAVAFDNGPFHREVASTRLPDRLRLGGIIHTITDHWGPERIETGWWHGPSIRRDYYRIETDQGRWWWIFRNLGSVDRSRSRPLSRWMLHGQFD